MKKDMREASGRNPYILLTLKKRNSTKTETELCKSERTVCTKRRTRDTNTMYPGRVFRNSCQNLVLAGSVDVAEFLCKYVVGFLKEVLGFSNDIRVWI